MLVSVIMTSLINIAALIDAQFIPHTEANTSTFAQIISILLVIIGAMSMLVIVIAGLFFVISVGDPGRTGRAKRAIIYAGVGLAVSALAQMIINFVINRF